VEDTTDGIALTFVSESSERIEELQERVRDAAGLHGPFGRRGRGHRGRHGSGGHHGLQAATLPPSRALIDIVPEGARLTLEPLHASDLEVLRARVRVRAASMTTLPCDG
jgi:hypothetical protein